MTGGMPSLSRVPNTATIVSLFTVVFVSIALNHIHTPDRIPQPATIHRLISPSTQALAVLQHDQQGRAHRGVATVACERVNAEIIDGNAVKLLLENQLSVLSDVHPISLLLRFSLATSSSL